MAKLRTAERLLYLSKGNDLRVTTYVTLPDSAIDRFRHDLPVMGDDRTERILAFRHRDALVEPAVPPRTARTDLFSTRTPSRAPTSQYTPALLGSGRLFKIAHLDCRAQTSPQQSRPL